MTRKPVRKTAVEGTFEGTLQNGGGLRVSPKRKGGLTVKLHAHCLKAPD